MSKIQFVFPLGCPLKEVIMKKNSLSFLQCGFIALLLVTGRGWAQDKCFDRVLQVLLDERKAPVVLPSGTTEKTKLQFEAIGNRTEQVYFQNASRGSEYDYLRFIRRDDYERMSKFKTGPEMYGVENFKAWTGADDYLKAIPRGKLDLSIDLINEVHGRGSEGLNPILKKFSPIIPDGYVPTNDRVLKKRPSFGRDPLFEPLTEEQYTVIKNNPWLEGFLEVPGSKPGKRRGIILYAKTQDVKPKLEKLIKWYNDNKTTMDPVELAARFQQAYISIHPHVDGNGRASRLLMDRILAEYNIPAPIIKNTELDLYLDPKAWAKEVQDGVDEAIEVIKKSPSRGIYAEKISIGDSPVTSKAEYFGKKDGLYDAQITVGNQAFTLGEDGFLYSKKGIPYYLNKEENTLLPVADETYLLYSRNRVEYTVDAKTNKVKDASPKDDFSYDFTQGFEETKLKNPLSQSQFEVAKNHLRLIRDISKQKVDQKTIKVADYSLVNKANKEGKIFLHPSQKTVFKEAVTLPKNLTAKQVFMKGVAQTSLEKGWRMDGMQILAQYEKMDLEYYNYLKYAQKEFPEMVPEIMESRRKIHAAGRELLKPYLDAKKALGPESQKILKENETFKLYDEYLAHSKLGFENFDEGLKKLGDDKVYLLRADHLPPRYIGFRSQEHYAQIFERIPGAEKFESFIKRFQKEVISDPEEFAKFKAKVKDMVPSPENNKALYKALPKSLVETLEKSDETLETMAPVVENLVKNIFAKKWEVNGLSEEAQRLFVDYTLHAQGTSGRKAGISFTSNPALLMRPGEQKTAYVNENFSARVYLVSVPKKDVHWNYASGYENEYEFIADKPVSPFNVIKAFDPKKNQGEITPEIQSFMEQ